MHPTTTLLTQPRVMLCFSSTTSKAASRYSPACSRGTFRQFVSRPIKKPHVKEIICASYEGYGYSATTQRREAQLDVLRQELKALEDERDEAVRVAESCAKTCVRLTDMSKLLEDLALEKVKAGDEAGAKVVLQEKNLLREIIDKSNTKAQANFSLAGKLAGLIGDKHNELVGLLGGHPATAGGDEPTTSSASRPSGGGGYTSPYSSSSLSYGGYQMPWERSLAEAQQRVRQAEAEAQRMGRLAALSAEDSIAAARERLRAQDRSGRAAEDILQARERLRRSAESSIAEAQERLRAQDSQILEYCRRIVARYRRGEPPERVEWYVGSVRGGTDKARRCLVARSKSSRRRRRTRGCLSGDALLAAVEGEGRREGAEHEGPQLTERIALTHGCMLILLVQPRSAVRQSPLLTTRAYYQAPPPSPQQPSSHPRGGSGSQEIDRCAPGADNTVPYTCSCGPLKAAAVAVGVVAAPVLMARGSAAADIAAAAAAVMALLPQLPCLQQSAHDALIARPLLRLGATEEAIAGGEGGARAGGMVVVVVEGRKGTPPVPGPLYGTGNPRDRIPPLGPSRHSNHPQ
ncbi:hypothetical protein VOLCADRAFT_107293 [Volvox carteri f. nagariensis]|uniref:Uncharacterized protein n=1 Tax=Volvox carteri f. nagariensis TaxID=3068 RepID=D8UD19_VOLCA|nr:uncharacterized protein VOLCADRAFT_107293 [Volvox carteri f. nagariensis]EFJ42319.1 hypothetical protein VOLCADRAFT_107293 [Volvox carteri f. nagariensis]|eukprot:XP_002956552.1 hypothetical protein VOLCADRAFT_107293 [Volvox carteri f. nagariensis]